MSEAGPQRQPDDAVVDLLVKQVTEGLSPTERQALDGVDGAMVDAYVRGLERAAAAISLAVAPGPTPPQSLRARLEQQAEYHAAALRRNPGVRAEPVAAPRTPASSLKSRIWGSSRAGWLAAAACLVLALAGWLRPATVTVAPAPDTVVALPPQPLPPQSSLPQPSLAQAPPAVTPSPAEERAALLARSGSLKITLGATKDPAAAGVTGDVVWDPATQTGFIRFAGLTPNDPQVRQYQVWIFDGARDKRYPVDGGVFDVGADAPEIVIPIHAALPIRKLAALAVTVEKPGGVVVSARDHVVALGAAG